MRHHLFREARDLIQPNKQSLSVRVPVRVHVRVCVRVGVRVRVRVRVRLRVRVRVHVRACVPESACMCTCTMIVGKYSGNVPIHQHTLYQHVHTVKITLQ